MTNIELAATVLQKLFNCGINEFVVCAGSRNSPLIMLLEKMVNIRKYFFFNENSAAFFALGRIKRLNKPVAIITTSGTAVAELLPAAIEAYYSSLPLVMVTADRPKECRFTGAPQAIEQKDLLRPYAKNIFDLDLNSDLNDFLLVTLSSVTHINVCFKDLLLDEDINSINLSSPDINNNLDKFTCQHLQSRADWPAFCAQVSRPLVIVGSLAESDRPIVTDFLKDKPWSVYAECLSGLRESLVLKNKLITGGASFLAEEFKCNTWDGILRIGGVPTVSLWRQLEISTVPIFSLTNAPLRGLGRMHALWGPIASEIQRFRECSIVLPEDGFSDFWGRDRLQYIKLQRLFFEHHDSETAMIAKLSNIIPQGAAIYLGNSMPIRNWDLAASRLSNNFNLMANRGANGIDGQLSTFLGWCCDDHENWAILGDLTALYDLSGLWASRQITVKKIRIVIVNNHGGQIFAQLYPERLFRNEHELNFSGWAQMWGFSYLHWQVVPDELDLPDRVVIELCPAPNLP